MPLRAAELEVLFTANTADVERGEKTVKAAGERIEKKAIAAKVTADEKGALAGMDRVEEAAKKIVSAKTVATVDANIERAEKGVDRVKQRLEYLQSVETDLDVSADIKRAEANLSKLERNLDGLRSARTKIEVDADTAGAEESLQGVSDVGAKAGKDTGEEFGASAIAALASIPIVGAVVGVGAAAATALIDSFQDGLQQEVGRDRLQALTGIDEQDALRLSRTAGEAYTRGFGESIEANMDTTRLALQFNIIDEGQTTRSSQKVIEGLSGIADVLQEDVQPIAYAVTTLMRTGLAKSADEAFDILAAGQREGLNRADDLIDTFTEYPVVLRRLGLSGQDALGLMNQGLDAGARNTDVLADALKEFQIRATDGSKASAAGYERLGLSAADMTAQIAAGGEGARAGLQIVLDKLRETEDPVVRNAAAVELFGTKAEDLGDALFALDLDTAAGKFDNLQGSAQRMFDTLASNDSARIQGAQRNIEVAADGIKGALASAFSEPLGDLADFVSKNRGPVMQFLLDLANGALDFGESMVESTADGTIALGDFVAGPLADAVEGVATLLGSFGQDTTELKTLAEDMRGFDKTAAAAAETMRTKLIDEGIDPARDRLNEFGNGAVAMGFLNDASLRLAESLGTVGYGADGAKLSLEGIDFANVKASESGRALEGQVRNSVAALSDEIDAAERTGESQEALAERYRAGTEALVGQLTQMGLTEGQARSLIDTVLQTPASATTAFGSNAGDERSKVQALADRIDTLPDGTVVIRADTSPAYRDIEGIQAYWQQRGITIPAYTIRQDNAMAARGGAIGGIVEFMAQGGLRGLPPLVPMERVAQVVPPSTWRVVGDRTDVPESFIPIDGSPRSMSILLETMRRMGVTPMGLGGITEGARAASGSSVAMTNYITTPPNEDPRILARELGREFADQLAGR